MLKRFIYFPMLLLVFNIQAQNQNTTFNDLVGYTVDSTGIITKTGGDGWNNSMATSNQEIVANDIGSVTYVVQTENDKMALGLSTASTDLKVSSINYRMMIDKKLALWEGKKNKGNYGNLVIGDVLEIARVETGEIQFKKNGNILLAIPTDINQVLYVKFVLQSIGQTLPARSIVGDFYEEMQISSTINHETCLIDNIGAIDLTVAKGFPPFTYSWSSGASTEDLTSLTTGDYTVTVTDAANKQQTKTIKIQKEVVWVDAQKTTSLSKNRLITSTDGNVSYQVDQEGFTKSFGLEEQKEEQVSDVIDYSIKLTNNGLIEIFWQGAQLLGDFGTYALGDVLKVEKLGDQIIYKKNETTIATGAIDVAKKMVARYILFTTGATFNNVNTDFCNIPLEVTYTTTLVSQNQLGSIQVFPMYGTPPYTYAWTDGETTQNRTDLESGIYRLMVTDAGLVPDRIKVIIPVGMELEFTELQGVDVVNNEELVKTAPENSYGNAMATLNNIVEGDGEVRMEIAKTDQEFVVGFRNIDNLQATIYQELAYGFVINQSNFSTWDNEELTPLGTIEVGDVLSIEKINATIYYKKNEEVLREIQIKQKGIVKSIDLASNTTVITRVCNGEEVTCTRSLETGIVEGSAVEFDINKTDSLIEEIVAVKALQEQSTPLVPIDKVSECVKSEANQSQFKIDFSLKTLQANITKISVFKFTAYPRIKGVVQHLDCNDSTIIASVETQIISGTPPYLYNWTGPNNQTFNTQNISVSESGLYTLNVTDSWINPHTASKTFEVGYQAKLCHVEGATVKEAQENLDSLSKIKSSSLAREKSAGGTCGRATSLNRLNPNDNGSITYIVDQIGYSKGFGLTTSSDLTNEPATADISSTSETLISEVSFGILLKPDGTINIRENELSVGDFGTFKIGDVLKVIREGNQIVYQHNDNVLKTTTTDPSLMLVARYLLIDNCATFNNLYTDFCFDVPYFVIDTKDTPGGSYRISGAGINETVASGTEEKFYPVILPGTTRTIEIEVTETTELGSTVSKVSLELNDALKVISSSLSIIDIVDNNETARTYGVNNYLNIDINGALNLRLSQLYTELISKGCFSNNDINWNSAKFFDEEGNLISSSQSFFNYLGNPTQTQSKNFTNNTVIGMESVYDAYGRSVLTTLPAPMYQSSFCYNDDFLKSATNTDYNYTQFDVPNYSSNPNSISIGEVDFPWSVHNLIKGSVGWYYSEESVNEEPYVAITPFPYSRIEYDPNNPGAIKRSSAPHNGLKMGSGHENKSFSMPASGELNYLFGFANGWTIQYDFNYFEEISDWDSFEIYNKDLITKYNVTKTISVDADGHESVSFVDIDGKLVATCYSGTGDNSNNVRTLPVTSFIKGQDFAERYIDIHLPNGTQTSLEIINEFLNGNPCYLFDILDLDKNVYLYQGVDGQSITLPAGYYRIINTTINCINLTSSFKEDIAIRYNLNYYDFTLYYYDKAGRLVTTIAPNGIDNNYDPNVIRTARANKDQFHQNGVNMPYLGSSTTNYEVDLAIPTTPTNSQQFSMALVYLTEHTEDVVPIGFETGRIANQPVPMSSGIGSYKLGDVIDDSHYDYVFANPCPGFRFTIPNNDLVDFWGANLNNPVSLELSAQNAAQYFCNTIHQDVFLVVPVPWNFCIQCISRPKTDVDKRYNVTVDLVTNNATLKTNILLLAEHHLVDATNATYWTFNLAPEQLFADSEGELIDIPSSLTANEVKAVVTNIKEFTRMYDASYVSWYYQQTYDYTYIHELDLHVAAITNEFPGGYPSHKPSEISQYNSISQVLKNITVDKGVTDYVYNEEGLLRFSRNNEQRIEGRFSYVNYDELGRPVESGEYNQNIATTGGMGVWFQNHYNEYPPISTSYPTTHPLVLNNSAFYDLTHAGKTTDINFTLYDAPDPDFYTATGLLPTNYTQQIFLGDISKTWNKSTENAAENTVTTWYSYDDQGRVLWMVQKIKDLGVKTIDYIYNNAGDLIQVIYQKNNPTEYFSHQYIYDIDKRLINVTTSQDGMMWDQQAHYYYYQHGPLKRVELANNLQGIDYVYTSNGWLKSINSPSLGTTSGQDYVDIGNDSPSTNGFATDVFGITLDYFIYDYVTRDNLYPGWGDQTEIFNGNIKSVRWNSTKKDITSTGNHWMYSYQYNKKGWLKDATFGEYGATGFIANANNDYKVSNLTYDKNGNILRLNRNAYGTTPGMDNLYYHYIPNTNQLAGVDNTYSSAFANALPASQLPPFNSTTPSTFEYEYDGNGALITNKKDDQSFIYNVSGLVTHVYNADGTKLIATYDYDDKGYRYKKTLYNSLGTTIVSNTFYIRDASGTIQHVYTEDVITPANSSSEYPIYGAGRLGNYYKGGATVYELTDHLGNVRATINRIKVGNDASVEEYADYYPFGEKMPGRNSTSSLLYKYGYQGQEHDDETGYDAFELRLWDGRLGRWMSTDPYAQYHSPYLGMGNNPIRGIDPRGGVCETCPQDGGFADYINDGNSWTYDNGITFLSSLSDMGITDWGNSFGSNDFYLDNSFTFNNAFSNNSYSFYTGSQNLTKVNSIRFKGFQSNEMDGAASVLAGGWAGALIEPTPVGETVMAVATGIGVLYYGPDLVAKMDKEIDGIGQRVAGPQGFQYALTATRSGYYPNVRGGATFLNVGEVWKYGETTSLTRYSKVYLSTMGLYMNPQFFGNQMEIKIQEKIMIYGYFFGNGSLPPGNSIFR